jgi:hypothetical protein
MPDAPSSLLGQLPPRELSPAVRGLLQSFVPRGARNKGWLPEWKS